MFKPKSIDIVSIEDRYDIGYYGAITDKRTGRVYGTGRNKGYKGVELIVNGSKKWYLVHRLVATKYIPNPNNKITVNHKNGIKTDNRVENLEWCTIVENTLHAHRTGLHENGRGKQLSKMVLNTETGIYYDSITEASKSFSHLDENDVRYRLKPSSKKNISLLVL